MSYQVNKRIIAVIGTVPDALLSKTVLQNIRGFREEKYEWPYV